jgi:hypothetical protein
VLLPEKAMLKKKEGRHTHLWCTGDPTASLNYRGHTEHVMGQVPENMSLLCHANNHPLMHT